MICEWKVDMKWWNQSRLFSNTWLVSVLVSHVVISEPVLRKAAYKMSRWGKKKACELVPVVTGSLFAWRWYAKELEARSPAWGSLCWWCHICCGNQDAWLCCPFPWTSCCWDRANLKKHLMGSLGPWACMRSPVALLGSQMVLFVWLVPESEGGPLFCLPSAF